MAEPVCVVPFIAEQGLGVGEGIDHQRSAPFGEARDYNEIRPHMSLGWMTPVVYAAAAVAMAAE